MSAIKKFLGDADETNSGVIQRTASALQRSQDQAGQRSVKRATEDIRKAAASLKIDLSQELASIETKLSGVTSPARGKISPASGVVATVREFVRKLNGLGYSGWTASRMDGDGDDGASPTEVAETAADEYGIQVDPKQVKIYSIMRDYHNRSEPSFIIVAMMPGHVMLLDAGSDRASGHSGMFSNVDAAVADLNWWFGGE